MEAVVALMRTDARQYDPEAVVTTGGVASRLVGLRSWSRRQIVVVPADDPAGAPVAWLSCEDRAAGRTNVQLQVAQGIPDRDALASALLDWAEAVGGSFARHRGVEETQLDMGIAAEDSWRTALLTEHGYRCTRTWLHMERPVDAREAHEAPAPREGVRVRQVATHSTGLPVAQDVRTVHRMLEESFADHFNSYRESFAEFAARLTEGPESRWDHWWIAEVQQADGTWLPGGGLVSDSMPATASAGEGTYLEYLGVHRSARGRGVAKALLWAAIRDAAERGRTRVGLEVDDDSPTGADGLYASMGWRTVSRTESWHGRAARRPSRLLDPESVG